ncbi:phage virion morphogenesis protein [Blastomonas sp. CCH1-A6]|uniref:phage virion morphogenesis protein n=1 Tax=Blastomonas sp. CCH1-A6 TaxID=1768762 RepID=UPI00082E729C
MSGVSIDLFDQLTPALQRAIDAVGDLSAPMNKISGEWYVATLDRFRQQVDPLGVPWKPRSDGTTGSLLFKSGDMVDAIRPDHGETFAEVGVEATGGPEEYARIHNEGGVVRPKTGKALRTPFGAFAQIVIPKRQFIGASESDKANAVEILTDHLKAAFNGDAGGEP